MSKTGKAVIFSLIVFPGAGYFVLGKAKRGWAALVCTIVVLAILMVEAYSKAMIIAEKIVLGQIPHSIEVIREQILLTPGKLDPTIIEALSWGILVVWFSSLLDCYRIGKSEAQKV